MISGDELARLSDEVYRDSKIRTSLYCAKCGYNLRTLPFVHRCPECGNEYNARPLNMVGIFVPHHAYFPFGDGAATVFCLVAMLLIAVGSVVVIPPTTPGVSAPPGPPANLPIGGLVLSVDYGRLAFAAVFAVISMVFLSRAVRQAGAFFRDRLLLHKIIKASQDE